MKLSKWQATIFLPLILSGAAAQEPVTLPFYVDAPAGITINLIQADILIDKNGTVFAKTRADSSTGDIVWKTDTQGNNPEIVLELGPSVGRGNGFFSVQLGKCVLITATDTNKIGMHEVPGCVAP